MGGMISCIANSGMCIENANWSTFSGVPIREYLKGVYEEVITYGSGPMAYGHTMFW